MCETSFPFAQRSQILSQEILKGWEPSSATLSYSNVLIETAFHVLEGFVIYFLSHYHYIELTKWTEGAEWVRGL